MSFFAFTKAVKLTLGSGKTSSQLRCRRDGKIQTNRSRNKSERSEALKRKMKFSFPKMA